MNFAPPKCSEKDAWPTGKHAIGSMLVRANLSHNKIQVLNDLSHHSYLECLLLSYNKINQIRGMQELRYLQVISFIRMLLY